ncbi:hypothetical protein CBL_02080 [Carabus blaptoides fortunei]
MKAPRLLILSILLALSSCHPLSYQKVQFAIAGDALTKNKSVRTKLPSLNRNSRSFGYPWTFSSGPEEFWPPASFFPYPSVTIYDVSFERGHITPDYSNGLEYPDPLLLRGKNALIAAKYLYGRGPLFYHQIPHIRALLRNQQERRANGLDGNNLSSNRRGSPFYRV